MTTTAGHSDAAPGGIARRHDLDALRALAMLLGIVLHAALSFAPGLWLVEDSDQSDLFSLLFLAIHGFRMPVFFLMSGFFTAMLWRRRGLGALARQRTMRVFLPLVLAWVTIIPAMNYVTEFVAESQVEEAAVAAAEVDPNRNVWLAAATDNAAMLDEQLALGADLDAQDPTFGVTPLAWAAMQGHDAITQELTRRGADVNAPNRDGSTPLHGAAFMGRASAVALLLDNGAKVNAQNHNDETPLDSAAAGPDVTAYIAGILGLAFDEKKIEEGRRKASALLVARGGERNADPAAEKQEEQEDGSVAPWYWELVYSDRLTIREEGGEPFNPIHTPLFHHLWFLWFLLWLVALFAIFAAIADRLGWRGPLLPAWPVLSPAHFLWLVPLTFCLQWFMGLEGAFPTFGPDTSTGLIPLPHLLLYYVLFFGFGVVYFDHNDGGERIGRWWWLTLPVGLLVVFPLGMEFTYGDFFGFRDDAVGPGVNRFLAVLLQTAYPWLMAFGLIGLFRVLLRQGSYAVRYVSDASYWLYVTHLPLIILAQFVVRDWGLPAVVKFALICVVITGFLLLCYQGFVRYTPLGTLLNGKRTRPGQGVVEAEG